MITVKLPFPTSINKRYAHRTSKRLSDGYASFKQLASAAIPRLSPPVERSVWVWVHLEHPRPTSLDVDNHVKAILDAANGRVWLDDRQVAALFVTREQGERGSLLRIGYPSELPIEAMSVTVRANMAAEDKRRGAHTPKD